MAFVRVAVEGLARAMFKRVITKEVDEDIEVLLEKFSSSLNYCVSC